MHTNFTVDQTKDYIIHVIKGFDVLDDNGTTSNAISFESHCFIDNFNTMWCQLKNTMGMSFQYWFIGVDVIVYREFAMKEDYNGSGISVGMAQITALTDSIVIDGGNVVDAGVCFFGFKLLSKKGGQVPFDFDLKMGATAIDSTLANYNM